MCYESQSPHNQENPTNEQVSSLAMKAEAKITFGERNCNPENHIHIKVSVF